MSVSATKVETVDERVARSVAAMVVVLALAAPAAGWWVVLALLLVDFAVRAAGRPQWSALASLSRRVVIPRLAVPPRPVTAKPKRFSAGIGALMSAAALAALAAGANGVAVAILALLVAAAFLEAAFGFCVGCRIHALLAQAGIVSDDCPECADISQRIAAQRRW